MLALSVVVPIFDEADALPLLVARLRPVLDGLGRAYEVVAVDDGSRDATPVVLQRIRREWPQLRLVRLRANSGHQAALSAGLAAARGLWCVTIDADLQDPPETIPEMLRVAELEGVDVVYGVRSDRASDEPFKRVTARGFYAVMRRLVRNSGPANAGDFRLMSRATVDAVNGLPEHHRVLRLVVPDLGFPSAQVTYPRAARAAGRSKYPLSRMLALTLDSVTGFSTAPLRLATWFGLAGGCAAMLLIVYAVASRIMGHTVAGWTSTLVAVSAVGAVQLLCLGVLGEYVGRMYSQMQGRRAYYVAYDSLVDPSSPSDHRLLPEQPPGGDHPPTNHSATRQSPTGEPTRGQSPTRLSTTGQSSTRQSTIGQSSTRQSTSGRDSDEGDPGQVPERQVALRRDHRP